MIIALVGMPGSGKSEISRLLNSQGFSRIRFGDVTDEELIKRGLEINEENEKTIRNKLRKDIGMDVYAKLNEPKIRSILDSGSRVVIDGMRSFEEYAHLKGAFKNKLAVVHVYSSPKIRYERLGKRNIRPLSREECVKRDLDEILNLQIGGSIAMADFLIPNEGSIKDLKKNVLSLYKYLENNHK